jgi:acetyl-CoA acetyltransferase
LFKTCIAGIGQSEFRRWGGIKDRSQFQVTAEAILQAINDAGLKPEDIDGFTSFSNDANEATMMQVALGIPELRLSAMTWGGGGGGTSGAVSLAVAAVEARHAKNVVVYRGLCQGQSRRFGRFVGGRTHASFVNPFGLYAPAQMLALLVRRHMHLYPLREENLAEIALNARANANRNPRAIMHAKTLSEDDYYNARMISTPFRLYDCCLESDGACAVVVTSRERARDMKSKSVDILAVAHGSGPGWGSGPLGSQNMPAEDYDSTNNRRIAKELFAAAGLTPADIDVAEIYDHFSGMVLLALEDFGFCGRGESGDFVMSEGIRWDTGRLPLNTSGGHLSEAYVHGMNHLIEGVRQLRGESTAQVANAQTCLVTAGLGVAPTGGVILGRSA